MTAPPHARQQRKRNTDPSDRGRRPLPSGHWRSNGYDQQRACRARRPYA
jgi:hypothetical protein